MNHKCRGYSYGKGKKKKIQVYLTRMKGKCYLYGKKNKNSIKIRVTCMNLLLVFFIFFQTYVPYRLHSYNFFFIIFTIDSQEINGYISKRKWKWCNYLHCPNISIIIPLWFGTFGPSIYTFIWCIWPSIYTFTWCIWPSICTLLGIFGLS